MLKLNKICRLCVLEKDPLNLIEIHSIVCDPEQSFADIIKSTFQIAISPDDGLEKVCKHCLEDALHGNETFKKFHEADVRLGNIKRLFGILKIEDENETVESSLAVIEEISEEADVKIKESPEIVASEESSEPEDEIINFVNVNEMEYQDSDEDSNKEIDLQCNVCLKTFKRKQTLNEHISGIHLKDKSFSCVLCSSKVYTIGRHLNGHYKRVHNLQIDYNYLYPLKGLDTECILCPGLTFETNLIMQQHYLKVHCVEEEEATESSVHKCPNCPKAYTSSWGLNVHIMTHENTNQIVCSICSKSFDCAFKLENHKTEDSCQNRSYKCEKCPKAYFTKGHLKEHERIHSDEFACYFCDKRFNRKSHVVRHMKVHTKSHILSCEECPKTFLHERSLQEHLPTHWKGVKLACKVCGRQFFNTRSLKFHIRSKHGKGKPVKKRQYRYPCEICGKLFLALNHQKEHTAAVHCQVKEFQCEFCLKVHATKKILGNHIKNCHQGQVDYEDRPEECEICKKKFKNASHLKLHLKVHKGDRRHVCEICGFGFVMAGNLTKHMVVHTKEKPFKCQQCSKSFTQQGSLTVHMRYHDDSFYLQCSYCEKTFKTKNILLSHEATHTDEKNYGCDTCKTRYRHYDSLQNHSKKVHGIILESKREMRNKNAYQKL